MQNQNSKLLHWNTWNKESQREWNTKWTCIAQKTEEIFPNQGNQEIKRIIVLTDMHQNIKQTEQGLSGSLAIYTVVWKRIIKY